MRGAVELSELKVKNWPASDKRDEIADAGPKGGAGGNGLYLIVQPSGKKSWSVRYRWGPKIINYGIGRYPLFSLAKARDQAEQVQRILHGANPQDPRDVRKASKQQPDASERDLFRNVVERYRNDYAATRKSGPEKVRLLGLRMEKETGALKEINGGAVAAWGKKRIQDITPRDIQEHLDKIAKGIDRKRAAPFGANRTFAELRKFFKWAVSKFVLRSSPMTGMSPPTDMELERQRQRKRTLTKNKAAPGSTDDELRWLWKACDVEGWPFGPLIQLLVLTGCRREEVGQMKWAEVDAAEHEWIIPGERTKNKQTHIVPLSDEALAIVSQLEHKPGKSGYVFTTNSRNAVSGYSRLKKRINGSMLKIALEERGEAVTIPDWRLHDLRRTCAAGMQRLGVPPHIIEKALNHQSGTFKGIVGTYQVDDLMEERRAALQRWAGEVMRIVGNRPAGNVVPIRA